MPDIQLLLLLLQQQFYVSLDFVRDKPGEPVTEETFTHSRLSWSSIIPYLLPPFFTIRGILFVQISKQWHWLSEFIPSSSNSGLHRCISIPVYTQHVT